jgi:hypothetical protein
MFWRNISPLSSGLKNKPGKKPVRSSFPRYLLHARFSLGSFFDPEDGSDMFFRNVC